MTAALHLLDTNIASHIIKGNDPAVLARLAALPLSLVAVSSVTEAELQYGLAKRKRPQGLTLRVNEFLARVDVLPWDRTAAAAYGELRTACESSGISLGDLDMMIAAHAVSVNAILITRDQAFSRIPDGLLRVERWAA